MTKLFNKVQQFFNHLSTIVSKAVTAAEKTVTTIGAIIFQAIALIDLIVEITLTTILWSPIILLMLALSATVIWVISIFILGLLILTLISYITNKSRKEKPSKMRTISPIEISSPEFMFAQAYYTVQREIYIEKNKPLYIRNLSSSNLEQFLQQSLSDCLEINLKQEIGAFARYKSKQPIKNLSFRKLLKLSKEINNIIPDAIKGLKYPQYLNKRYLIRQLAA